MNVVRSASRFWAAHPKIAATLAAVSLPLVGWYANNYVQRAKPEIVITSISFGGPSRETPIEIKPEIIYLSNEAYSVNGLPKFETYASLTSYYDRVVMRASALQSSLDSVNNWRTQHSGYNAQLAEKAIRSHPIIRDEAVVRGLAGKVNRAFPVPDLLPDLGHPASDCKRAPEDQNISEAAKRSPDDKGRHVIPVAALSEAANNDTIVEDYSKCKIPGALLTSRDPKSGEVMRTWLILNNNVTPLTLSYPIWHPDYRKQWIDFIAETILSGNSEKLEWLSSRFVEYASAEVNTLRKLQQELRGLILPASSLKMTVSLYNVGQNPVAIKPAFAVHIVYQDTRSHDLNDIVMGADPGVRPEDTDRMAESYTQAGLDPKMMPPKALLTSSEDDLLQRHASSPYFAIGPSAQTELVLTSIAPLGSSSAALHDLLTAGSTQFQLVAERAGEGLIWSAKTTFSRDPGGDATDELQKLARQNKLDRTWLDVVRDLLPSL